MKNTLLTIAVTALTVSSFAQGTLNVGNNFTGTFRAPIYAPEVGNPLQSISGQSALGTPAGATVYTGNLLGANNTGPNYTFAVYAGAANVVDPNLLTLLVTTPFRSAAGNALPAGLITTLAGVIVPGVATGNQAALQVRAWDNTTGATYELATTKGASALFLSGPLGGGVAFAPDMTGWTSFNIYAVPEPSTFVLAGLGAAALVIFRRRK
jgi:hypothetical protein